MNWIYNLQSVFSALKDLDIQRSRRTKYNKFQGNSLEFIWQFSISGNSDFNNTRRQTNMEALLPSLMQPCRARLKEQVGHSIKTQKT